MLRVPLLTPRLAHWDAVNYALGLHQFDIAAHQPHPPGSPYFILLGRAALALVGDDNLALQLISLAASIGAVLAEFALVSLVFGRTAAVLAALVLMTNPIFWGYGTTATAWTLLACLAIALLLGCMRLLQGQRRELYPSALFVGLVSGFRTDAAVFLAPLWLWALIRATPAWRDRALAVAIAGVSGLVWLVPVVAGAGGLSSWSARLLALFPPTDTSPAALMRQLAANTVISFGTVALVVGPPVALSFVVGGARALSWRKTVHSETVIFWSLAVLPAFTFLWLIDASEPGHDLVFIGGLVALGAGLLAHSAPTQARLAACGAVVLSAQTCLFLFAAPLYERPLAWTLDSMFLNVTATGLREQQSSLDATLKAIRTGFDPRTTAVVTLVDQDPYRFLMYHLPEFRVLRLDPRTHAALVAEDRQQGNWTEAADCPFGDRAVREIVWVLSAWTEAGTVPSDATLLSGGDTPGPFHAWYRDVSESSSEYLGFNFAGSGECSQPRAGFSYI